MPTKTRTTPEDRLAAAKAAEQAAQDRLTELRQRHIVGENPVSAEEFGAAGHVAELAALEREGAELAFAEHQRQERLAKLAEVAADIEANAPPTGAAEAFTRLADAIADLITITGPSRNHMITRWLRQLTDLGVPRTQVNERPSAEDAGLGWRDTGFGGRPAVVFSANRAVTGYDVATIVHAAEVRGCRQAGASPALLDIGSNTPPGLVDDPGAWFGAR